MCPSILNDFVEVLQTAATVYLTGDGSSLRKLIVQQLSAVTQPDSFLLLAKTINITSDEVRDSHIFTKCNSLKLMKYLTTNYEISKDAAIQAFYRAFHRLCNRESFEIAVWLSDQFQLTKDDLFTDRQCIEVLADCINDEAVKWLVEKYQITLADMGDSPFWRICVKNDSLERVRWMSSTYAFERDDVLKAFFNICADGPLETVQFLTECYKLTADEIRRDNQILLHCDDLDVRAWILDNYYTSRN